MARCHVCGELLDLSLPSCPSCATLVPSEKSNLQRSVGTGNEQTSVVHHYHQSSISHSQSSGCTSCGSINPLGLNRCVVPNCNGTVCEGCCTYKGEQVSLCNVHYIQCSCGLVYRHYFEDLIICEEEGCSVQLCNRCRKPTMRNLGMSDTAYMCLEHNNQTTIRNVLVGVGIATMFVVILVLM